ncbi:hypothetical protein Tco_1038505 [Tanacetum coccineum]
MVLSLQRIMPPKRYPRDIEEKRATIAGQFVKWLDMVSLSNAPLESISKNLTFQTTTTTDLVTNFMCIDTGVSHLQIPPSPLPPSTAHRLIKS